MDSNRLLTFPNPAEFDVPHLYASHPDYLRISYDLVRRGVRFGGNNWTPVRARSDVDPVNRNIWTTCEQLRELYRKGLYGRECTPASRRPSRPSSSTTCAPESTCR